MSYKKAVLKISSMTGSLVSYEVSGCVSTTLPRKYFIATAFWMNHFLWNFLEQPSLTALVHSPKQQVQAKVY